MNKTKKNIIRIILIFSLLLLLKEVGDGIINNIVVATIDDQPIIFKDIYRVYKEKNTEVSDITYDKILNDTIDDFVLIDISNLSEDYVNNLAVERIELLKNSNPSLYQHLIGKLSEDKYKEYLKDNLKIQNSLEMIENKFSGTINISENSQWIWYTQNISKISKKEFNNFSSQTKKDISNIIYRIKINEEINNYMSSLRTQYTININSNLLNICSLYANILRL